MTLSQINQNQFYIAGQWYDAQGGTIDVISPADGHKIGTVGCANKHDVNAAVNAALHAKEWRGLAAFERGRFLQKMSQLILENIEELAKLEAIDVGKPLSQAKADVIACSRYMEFYAGAADKIGGESIPFLQDYTALTLREPHGVCAHIIPWNYPLQIIGRSIGGALAMGNSCVLKPSEDAALSSLALTQLAHDARLPQGALNVIVGYGAEAGEALVKNPNIDHISFTGSYRAGVAIQQASAPNMIPLTLELGGKSAQIVFADADLDVAVPFLLRAAIQNAGQTCSAASRILIERPIYRDLMNLLKKEIENLTIGDPLDDPDVGPLINQKQYKQAQKFLAKAQNDGATVFAQTKLLDTLSKKGYYIAPVLLDSVTHGMEIAQQELFAPVLMGIPFESEQEACCIANDTNYGLVSSVWTNRGARQWRIAKALKVGQVFVNNYGAGGGVELPFGGRKLSGYGKEKGLEALYGFSVCKAVAFYHK